MGVFLMIEKIRKLKNLLKVSQEKYVVFHLVLEKEIMASIISEINGHKGYSDQFHEDLKSLMHVLLKTKDNIPKKTKISNEIPSDCWSYLLLLTKGDILKTFFNKEQELAKQVLMDVMIQRKLKNFKYIFEEIIQKMENNSVSINFKCEKPLFIQSFETDLRYVALKKIKKSDLIDLKKYMTEDKYALSLPGQQYFHYSRASSNWLHYIFSVENGNIKAADKRITLRFIENELEGYKTRYSYQFEIPKERQIDKDYRALLLNLEYFISVLKEVGENCLIIIKEFLPFLYKVEEKKRLTVSEPPRMINEINDVLPYIQNLISSMKSKYNADKIIKKITSLFESKEKNNKRDSIEIGFNKREVFFYDKDLDYYNFLNGDKVLSHFYYVQNVKELDLFIKENPELYSEELKFLTKDGEELFKLEYAI